MLMLTWRLCWPCLRDIEVLHKITSTTPRMLRSTTLAAGPCWPPVPYLGDIKTLVNDLEEGHKYRHSKSSDGAKAPKWVDIWEAVKHHPGSKPS